MADGKGEGEVSKEAVLAALSQIEDPDLGRDIVSLGFVKDEEINVSGGSVSVRIVLTTPARPVREKMKAEEEAVRRAGGADGRRPDRPDPADDDGAGTWVPGGHGALHRGGARRKAGVDRLR